MKQNQQTKLSAINLLKRSDAYILNSTHRPYAPWLMLLLLVTIGILFGGVMPAYALLLFVMIGSKQKIRMATTSIILMSIALTAFTYWSGSASVEVIKTLHTNKLELLTAMYNDKTWLSILWDFLSNSSANTLALEAGYVSYPVKLFFSAYTISIVIKSVSLAFFIHYSHMAIRKTLNIWTGLVSAFWLITLTQFTYVAIIGAFVLWKAYYAC